MGKRRERGYAWESNLCRNINNIKGWEARRLGGTTTTMPDIIATHDSGLICGIECKSTSNNYAYVSGDQIIRCGEICNMFSLYIPQTILAFKYTKNKEHKLKKTLYMINYNVDMTDIIRCRHDSTPECKKVKKGKWKPLNKHQCTPIQFNESGIDMYNYSNINI